MVEEKYREEKERETNETGKHEWSAERKVDGRRERTGG